MCRCEAGNIEDAELSADVRKNIMRYRSLTGQTLGKSQSVIKRKGQITPLDPVAIGSDSLRPVSSSVATLGEPEYFPAMYRIPSNTCNAAVSFETISGGVMFCHRGNNPPAWNKSARASAVYIQGSS